MTTASVRRWGWGLLAGAALLLSLLPAPVRGDEPPVVVDSFDDVSGWTWTSSEGVDFEIAQDTGSSGMGMRLDFDFHESGGFVIARKDIPIRLPADYAFTFQVRGTAPPNNLEFKLIDPSGDVWWRRLKDFNFTSGWQQVTIKKSRIGFAWGPSGGAPLRRVATVEFAISSGADGKGSVWIDELTLVPRAPPPQHPPTPKVRASTSEDGQTPERIFDDDPYTSWHSGSVAGEQWLLLDFQYKREFGGLIIDWDRDDYATHYQVETSDDAETWTPAYTCRFGNGGRDYAYMPDADARYVRLALEQSSRGKGYAISSIEVEPFEFSASPNHLFEAIARDSPLGTYPKYLTGQQTYWTVVGVNGDDKEALLNEEGMLEVDSGSFSIEPFLHVQGKLVTWHDVEITQSLAEGYLPIPSVHWQNGEVSLDVTAFADGPPGDSILHARYRATNRADVTRHVNLYLAIRPFQVNPPWQSLNFEGGVAPIRVLAFDRPVVWVNSEKAVLSLTIPDRFGAASFDQGSITEFLLDDKLPALTETSDPFGFASGALQYSIDLDPGESKEVFIAIPFHAPEQLIDSSVSPHDAVATAARELDEAASMWHRLLDRTEFDLPESATAIDRTVKTTLAYTLINRDGPAIHPGPRTYARSWIRDGAITSAALLTMGFTEEVRDFIRWYAQFQFDSGKVPCCVDRRGADHVSEHGSNGELIFTVAEYYRYTHDIGFVKEMWPHVVAAVDYIAKLRARRTTEAYRLPERRAYFGLLPQSISHEGYSAHPVHSYWDDFWALRGLKDATMLATAMADDEHAAAFAELRDSFAADLNSSIRQVIEEHELPYVPGSVELGDFDPTSTAIAVTTAGEREALPQAELLGTFARYYEEFQKRNGSHQRGKGYTPYEFRNVSAMVRLGQRKRAFDVLQSLMGDRRPPAWNEWAEVVWSDPTEPRFIGDMPHTWVGAGFVTAVRTMFAFENEPDDTLVLAAGLPREWIESPNGVAIKRLPTYYGVVNYWLQSDTDGTWRMRLSGDLHLPGGGIVLRPPVPRPLQQVLVNGQAIDSFDADSATIRTFPAEVVFDFGEPTPTSTETVLPESTAVPVTTPAGAESPAPPPAADSP